MSIQNPIFEYLATTKAGFLEYLSKQDTTVPSRTEGRKPKHCERWSGFRLLATFATSDYFSFPLKVIHQDKPDFFLSFEEREVGIEFTEAVQEEWAATDAEAEKMGIEPILFSDLFKRGTPKRTKSERRELIKNPPMTDGWGNGGMRREWACQVKDRIAKKTEAFRKPDFKKYGDNWLLIYDNLSLPIHIRELVQELLPLLNGYWSEEDRFDEILIHSDPQLVDIHPDHWNQRTIVDLWN